MLLAILLRVKTMDKLQFDNNSSVGSSSTRKSVRLLYLLLVVTAAYVVFSSYFIFDTRSLVAAQQAAVEKLAFRQDLLENHLAVAEGSFKVASETLAQRLGITERDLQQRMQARTAELQRQQQTFARRQQEQWTHQQEQIGQVSGEVANVRTELGGAKTDIAATRTDLEATKVKLERAIGDLTGQGTLIARTREELEELKHRGDRNYYEFSLWKGNHPTPVSTVSLQLKKVNAKKNKFTLNVMADDRTIEKKDRGVAEPLQFYTGRDRLLYEVVVFTTDNNKVTGYLSTPKSAPAPVSGASAHAALR
jgi:predicted transcriptional regulator